MAVLLQASFRGFSFWALDWAGPDGRRIVKHAAYGRDGVETEDTGSDGRDEQVTGQFTVAQYKQLRTIIHEAKVGMFTHPRLGSWRARANISVRRPAPGDVNKVQADLTFTEDTAQPPSSPYDDETPTAKKKQAESAFDDADDIMSGSPGNADTQALYAAFRAARIAYDAEVSAWEDGSGEWQDVQRVLGALKSTGWAVVDNLRAFSTFEEDAFDVENYIIKGLAAAHDYTEIIRQQGQHWFKVEVVGVQDLYSLCKEVYRDKPDQGLEQAEKVSARNDILDVFCIESGTVLEFPILRGAA